MSLKITKRQIPLLIGSFIGGVTCGVAWPSVHAQMIVSLLNFFGNDGKAALAKFNAAENLFACITGLLVAYLWPKLQKHLVKRYTRLEIVESVFITVFYLIVLFTQSAIFYFIADLAYYCLLGSLIGKCSSTCRNYLFPTPQEKTDADTNTEFVSNLSNIIGLAAALLLPNVSFTLGIVLFLVGDLIRTGTVIFTYTKYSSYLVPAYIEK